ncbi:MAG: hypothetical protein ABIP17_13880 [Ilumatobacteraceae bacterium]
MKNSRAALIGVAAVGLAWGAIPASPVQAVEKSSSDVHWWWDSTTVTGSSTVVRNEAGITARLSTSGLTPGDAVTLWFIVFNNPDACASDPCAVPEDLDNPDTEADFHFAGGHVVGRTGTSTFAGRLNVGETRRSGLVETGLGAAVPLSNPLGAQVTLALHSHGPATPGGGLDAQIHSFLGGCTSFNGPNGFAAGFDDLPDTVGECSTFQYSVHS